MPCSVCMALYLEDVLYGRQALTMLPEQPAEASTPKNGVGTPQTWVSNPPNGIQGPLGVLALAAPKVPMMSFAKFFAAPVKSKVSRVRDIRSSKSGWLPSPLRGWSGR